MRGKSVKWTMITIQSAIWFASTSCIRMHTIIIIIQNIATTTTGGATVLIQWHDKREEEKNQNKWIKHQVQSTQSIPNE